VEERPVQWAEDCFKRSANIVFVPILLPLALLIFLFPYFINSRGQEQTMNLLQLSLSSVIIITIRANLVGDVRN